MKKTAYIIFLFLICTTVNSQQLGIQWQKSIGSSTTDIANCIQQTSEGGFIILGQTYNTNNGDVIGNNGDWDYWLVKLNYLGAIQWKKCYGGSTIDQGMSVRQTTDGGYILSGLSTSFDGDVSSHHSSFDYWIVKVDASGIIQWEKSYGGSGIDMGYEITQTVDGGYIVVGQTISNNGDVTGNKGVNDYWIIKLDASGMMQWQKTFGGTGQDYGNSIQQTSDGGYIVGGFSNSNNGDVSNNNGNWDYWILKLNSTGTVQWQKCLGGSADDKAYQIKQANDGGFVVVGYTSSADSMVTNNHGATDVWVVKLNSFGILQWQKSLGGTGFDYANSICQTTDDGYIIAGYSNSVNGDVIGNQGLNEYWVVKLDASGIFQWQRCFGGSLDEMAKYVVQTTDFGYVVAGQSKSTNGDVSGNHGDYDYWILKLDPSVGINENENRQIITVFPNPGSNKFTFTGITNGNKIQIYDITGRLILQTPSQYSPITIDMSAFESGIYFYKIIGSKLYSGKLIKN